MIKLGLYNNLERNKDHDSETQSEFGGDESTTSTSTLMQQVSGCGFRRNSTRQNQQFNDLITNNFKTAQINGLNHTNLSINSSMKGDCSIVLNKLISINNTRIIIYGLVKKVYLTIFKILNVNVIEKL